MWLWRLLSRWGWGGVGWGGILVGSIPPVEAMWVTQSSDGFDGGLERGYLHWGSLEKPRQFWILSLVSCSTMLGAVTGQGCGGGACL